MFWRKKSAPKEAEKAKKEKLPEPIEMPAMEMKEVQKAGAEKLPAPMEMPKMEIKEAPKAKVEKLPGPQAIPELVGKHLITVMKADQDRVWHYMAVVRPSSRGQKVLDIRVFDQSEAASNRITVKDYTSLDAHPDLIYYEGWFDKGSKRVEMEEKKVIPKVTIYTGNEIRQKIEALSEPGSTVFFYLSGSPASGGPLGRGAAVVELNPNYPGKSQKKYIMYMADVKGMEPVGKGRKFMESDKAKELASWIRERHFVATRQ